MDGYMSRVLGVERQRYTQEAERETHCEVAAGAWEIEWGPGVLRASTRMYRRPRHCSALVSWRNCPPNVRLVEEERHGTTLNVLSSACTGHVNDVVSM